MPSRSGHPLSPGGDPWEQAHRDLAGLFDVRDLTAWHRIDTAQAGDESSEVSLFGMASGSVADLRLQLGGRNRPQLSNVLGEHDTFAHLSIVRDRFPGDRSYLAVATHRDQSRRIAELALTFNERWDEYERRLPSIHTFEDFAEAMEHLLRDPAVGV